MYKKITLVLCATFLLANLSFSQTFEVGLFMGASNYMGDLQSKHVERAESKMAFGIYGKYNFTDYLSARVGFTKGQISGNDRYSENETGRKMRNLHFQSKISEINILAECHFLAFLLDERPWVSPYVFGGIAGFHFNPQAVYENQVYDLQPLGTEGQGLEGGPDKYGLYQIALPAGFGAEMKIGGAIKIGAELGLRKTFTDYLDDISGNYADIELLEEMDPVSAALAYRSAELEPQLEDYNPVGNIRGNPNNKDWYVFGGLSFIFNISALTELGGGPGIYNPF